MIEKLFAWKYWAIGISIILFFVLIAFNDVLELRAEEGRRALVSIEMVEQGNIIVPTLFGQPYYNKPPVFNWIIAFFIWLFQSSSEWVIRFPGAVSLVLTSWVLYLFCKRYVNSEHAPLYAIAFLCSGDLLMYGSANAGEMDLFYSLIVLIQILSIYHFQHIKSYWKLFLFSYLFMTIGFFTKGIPSIAFQALTLFPFLVWRKEWKLLLSPWHFGGIGLFLSIAGCYFYLYSQQEDAFTYFINIFQQASQRTLSENPMQRTILGLFNFPFLIISKILPWSFFLLFLFLKPIREKIKKVDSLRFFTLFLICNLIIYWLSPGTKIRYLYMFFPFLTVIFLEASDLEGLNGGRIWSVFKTLIVLGFIISAIALIIIPWTKFFPFELSSVQIFYALLGAVILGFLSYFLVLTNQRKAIVWTLILALFIIRLAYNLIGMPLIKKSQDFHNYANHLIRSSDQADIKIFGSYAMDPTFELFGHVLVERKLEVPLEMPYQVAYYYYQETGKLMGHDRVRQSSEVYFALDTQVKKSDSILDRNSEIYKPNTVVLFRSNPFSN